MSGKPQGLRTVGHGAEGSLLSSSYQTTRRSMGNGAEFVEAARYEECLKVDGLTVTVVIEGNADDVPANTRGSLSVSFKPRGIA